MNLELNILKNRIPIVLGFLFCIFFLALCLSAPAEGKTIIVAKDGSGDHKTIQAGILEAKAGDTVRVFEGSYQENLLIDKSINLVGNGSDETKVEPETEDYIVKITAEDVVFRGFLVVNEDEDFECNAAMFLENARNALTEETTIRNHYGSGSLIINSRNSNVSNCVIENGRIAGLDIRRSSPGVTVKNCLIQNYDSSSGIYLEASNCSVINTRIQNCDNYPSISVTASARDSFIENCTIEDCYNGIRVRAPHSTILNTTIANTHSRGIDVSGGDFRIENCSIQDNAGEGIFFTSENVDNSLISNTRIINNSHGLKFVDDCTGNRIINCSIQYNRKEGVYLLGEKNLFSYCQIENNTLNGVYINVGEYNRFANTTISNNGLNGTSTQERTIFDNCSLSGNAGSGIMAQGHCWVYDCVIERNSEQGVNQSGSSGTLSMYRSTVGGNGITGVYVSYSSTFIEDSSIKENNVAGVFFTNAYGGIIRNCLVSSSPTGVNLSSGWRVNEDVKIEDSVIEDCHFGIMLSYTDGAQIINCHIQNNSYGISGRIYRGLMKYCVIANNSKYGFYTTSIYQEEARDNWWGDDSGPYHPELNPDGTGDNISYAVRFFPWTNGPRTVYNRDKSGSYRGIEEACQNANKGDTIVASQPFYPERFTVRRSVNIITNSSTGTVINGQRYEDTITIEADWVNITGFVITEPGDYSTNVKAQNCTITRCQFSGAERTGVYGYNVHNLSVIDCNFSSSKDQQSSGVTFDTGNDLLIQGCDFRKLKRGVELRNSERDIIQGNNFRDIEETAAYLFRLTDHTIANNSFDNASLALDFRGCFGRSLMNNNRINNCENAIDLITTEGCELNGNQLLNIKNHVLYLMNSRKNKILDNDFSQCHGAVLLYRSPENLFSRNKLPEQGISFLFDDSEANWQYQDIAPSNTIGGRPVHYYKNKDGGEVPENASQVILVGCSNMTVSGVNVTQCQVGLTLIQCRDILVKDSHFDSGSTGVYLWDSHNSWFENNSISGNSMFGIEIWESSSSLEFHNGTIANNRNAGLMAYADCEGINATNNWWGHSTGPYHHKENRRGLGNQVSGDQVVFEPWTGGREYPVKNLRSGKEYINLQDAIDNATAGDTLRVHATIYFETIFINKTLSIIGNGSSDTFIDCEEEADVVTINANWVNFSGFRVKGISTSYSGMTINGNHSWVNDTNASGMYTGIYVSQGCHNTSLYNNSCLDNEHYGIFIRGDGSSHNRVVGNNLSANRYGLYSYFSDGLLYGLVQNNSCWYNEEYGLRLSGIPHALVDRNLCVGGVGGIYVYNNGPSAIISNNSCFNGDGKGIHILGRYGHITLQDNNCSYNQDYGIWLAVDSENITVESNHLWFNAQGIFGGSVNCSFLSNIIGNCDSGIELWLGSSVVANNTIDNTPYGITLTGSGHRLESNRLHNSAIFFSEGGSMDRWLSHSIGESNTVNGEPVYYFRNRTSLTLPEDVGQLILVNCSGLIFRDLELSNTATGPTLAFCSSMEFHDSNFSENRRHGLFFYYSDDIRVENCSFSGNQDSGLVFAGFCEDNVVVNNSYWNNKGYGIWSYVIDSDDGGSSSSIFNHNHCQNNTRGGILVNGEDNIISENNCSQSYGGIFVSGNDNQISDNHCSFISYPYGYAGTRGSGITVYRGDGNRITHNTVFGCDNGIYLDRSDSNILSMNSLESNEAGIIMDQNSVENSCTWNSILRSSEFGVIIADGSNSNSFSKNIIWKSHTGIRVVSSENNKFQSNLILNSTFCGFDNRYNGDRETDIKDNWWGHSSGPYNPTENPEGRGDNITDGIEFDPWLEEPPRWPPEADIDSIDPKQSLNGSTVSFSGHGTHYKDEIVRYAWRSDLDGELYNGTSRSFQYTGLTVGHHVIYFKVMNETGAWSSEDSWNIRVLELPKAHINMSDPYERNEYDLVRLMGYGESETSIYRYVWRSSIDGELYNGSKPEYEISRLSNGTHTIYLKVLDDYDLWSEEVSITLVVNGHPWVTNHNVSSTVALVGEEINFSAWATDDGEIRFFVWLLDGENYYVNSSSPNFTSSSFSEGWHDIVFMVLDDDHAPSNLVRTRIHIHVRPSAEIVSVNPSLARKGQQVVFTGNGTDDGEIASYCWYSDSDGLLYQGAEASFNTKLLSLGVHNISLRVLDQYGVWSENVSVDLTVTERGEQPDAFILSMEPDPAIWLEKVDFQGVGADNGEITRYLWNSSLDGKLYDGSEDSFSHTKLSPGTHTITLVVVDDEGYWSEEYRVQLLVNKRPEAEITSMMRNGETTEYRVMFAGWGTDDGSVVNYRWESSIDGLLYEGSEDRFSMKGLSVGNHTITLKVQDDLGVWSSETTATLLVTQPNALPVLSFTSPANGSTVSGVVSIKGIASDQDGSVESISLKVGIGDWFTITSTDSWSYQWDTSELENGEYQIQARAWDGRNFSQTVSLTLVVENKSGGEGGGGFLPGFEAFGMLAVLLGLAVLRKRR